MKEKFLYINGCSWTAGGGLETYGVCYKYYKTIGMSWNTHRDVNWPKKLSQKLDLQLVDESESGGGMERAIRMTFDYILSDLDRAKETLFIIEIPTAENRIDLYSTIYNSYLICNCNWKTLGDGKIKLNKDIHHSAVITYEKETFKERIAEKIKPTVASYLENFVDPFVYKDKIKNYFIGLYFFMKSLGLNFYLMLDGFSDYDINGFKKIDSDFENHFLKIKYKENEFNNFMQFTNFNKLGICDFFKNILDNHPSYEAHDLWSSLLENKFKNEL